MLGWIGAALGWANASHLYASLFTLAPIGSTAALGVGLCWSPVFGTLVAMPRHPQEIQSPTRLESATPTRIICPCPPMVITVSAPTWAAV